MSSAAITPTDPLRRLAALSAAVAIGAGAFAAHGAGLEAAALLKTGALYQLTHAAVAFLVPQRRPAWLMLGGASLFSLSLYALAAGAPRWCGAITPLGGVAMIAAWLWLAVRLPSSND